MFLCVYASYLIVTLVRSARLITKRHRHIEASQDRRSRSTVQTKQTGGDEALTGGDAVGHGKSLGDVAGEVALVGAEVEGVRDGPQRPRVSVAGDVAKGDGDLVDALDVVFANDFGGDFVAGLDGGGDGDAGDAGLGGGGGQRGEDGGEKTHFGRVCSS